MEILRRSAGFRITALLLIVTAAAAVNADAAAEMLRLRIAYCLETLIPSLFGCMVLANMLTASGAAAWLGYQLRVPARLMRIPPELLTVFLISQTAGYPVGAMLLRQMAEQGRLHPDDAARASYACFGGGPAFLVGLAGVQLFGSAAAGGLILGACVTVTNVDENDARFAQTVAVEPDSLYRISGMIRAEDCDGDGYGATLSIDGAFVYSESVYDTDGEWEYVEFYGHTGPSQTALTVFARVGGYGQLSRGRASFDDIAVVPVDEVPEDVEVQELYMEQAEPAAETTVDGNAEPPRNTESWLLFICVYMLAVAGFTRKRNRAAVPMEKPRLRLLFVLGLLAAFALRLVLAARVRGYNTDINCFTSWSERMFSIGPAQFYDPDYFCDYPPGYMLLLWPIAALRRLLNLQTNSAAYLPLLKLLPILADLGCAALAWRVARRKLSERGAMLLGLMMAFNPAAIADSAAWGQIDALLALAICLCALEAADGRYVRALLYFGAAMLLKPQALLFAPVGLAAIVAGILRAEPDRRGDRLRSALLGLAACLGLLYLAGFICCLGTAEDFISAVGRPIGWLAELYSGTVQGYRYVTVNTLNLHYLLGMNWARMEDHAALAAVAWALFGLSYAYCIALTFRAAKQPRRLFLTGATLILLICVFGPMIHERYVFPGLLLLALAFGCERDRRLLVSLTVLTATLFLNEVLA